jgi:anti-anti-sigma factor
MSFQESDEGQGSVGPQEWATARRQPAEKTETAGLTVRLAANDDLGRAGRVAVLSVVGEAEMGSADVLRAALDHTFGLPGVRNVVLDLTDLRFLDSIALVALIDAQNRARSEVVRLVLAGTGAQPWRVFQLTRTAKLFTFAASVESARGLLTDAAH